MIEEKQLSVKNVAIIIDSMTGGGAEKVMLILAETMSRQGHNVVIFILKDVVDYEVPTSVKIIHALKDYKKSIRGWRQRKEQAKFLERSMTLIEKEQGDFDLVLVNLYESMKLAQVLGRPNTLYVMHNDCKSELKRESLMGPLKYLYMRKILKGLHQQHLIGVSQALTDALNHNPLFRPASATCIYNPLDAAEVRRLAAVPGPQLPDKFILHVGRAAKAKRHDVLFKALSDVHVDYKLVCLSSGVKKLKKQAIKYGVAERVVLPGFDQNPYRWMKAATLVVLSSDFEGLPTVLIEALACGTPVVSTDCPFGPSEVLSGGLEANLVPVNDPKALADTINQALQDSVSVDDMPILKAVEPDSKANKYLSLTTEEI
ncbi:MAG: glycosyltransferase [Pseudomonadota bacterium]